MEGRVDKDWFLFLSKDKPWIVITESLRLTILSSFIWHHSGGCIKTLLLDSVSQLSRVRQGWKAFLSLTDGKAVWQHYISWHTYSHAGWFVSVFIFLPQKSISSQSRRGNSPAGLVAMGSDQIAASVGRKHNYHSHLLFFTAGRIFQKLLSIFQENLVENEAIARGKSN